MSKKEYPAKLTNGYYRVREVWEDEASQLGAYRLLANAKAKCDETPAAVCSTMTQRDLSGRGCTRYWCR